MRLHKLSSLLTVALLATTPMLASGCGGEEKASEKTIEKNIEEQSGQDVDVDVDDEKVTVESSEGTTVLNGGERPESIPDDFPIIDGEIATSMDNPEGAMVAIKVDDANAAFDEALTQLEDAGYTRDSVTDAGEAQMATFSGEGIASAMLMSVPDEGQLVYTITLKQ